jgi:putative peptidoglycan lipid II flippase
MVGYAVQNILSRAYFARQNGRTPLIAGAVSIGVNVVLCMALTDTMAVDGLAIASAVSATVYGLLLLIPMQREDGGVVDGTFCADLLKMLLAAVVMGACARGACDLMAALFGEGKLALLVSLGAGACVGLVVYFAVCAVLRLEEAGMAVGLVKRVIKRG